MCTKYSLRLFCVQKHWTTGEVRAPAGQRRQFGSDRSDWLDEQTVEEVSVSVSQSYWTCPILLQPRYLSSQRWSRYTKACRDQATRQRQSSHNLDLKGSHEKGRWKQRQPIRIACIQQARFSITLIWSLQQLTVGLDDRKGVFQPKQFSDSTNTTTKAGVGFRKFVLTQKLHRIHYQYREVIQHSKCLSQKTKTFINHSFPLSQNPSNCCHNHTQLSATTLQYWALQAS